MQKSTGEVFAHWTVSQKTLGASRRYTGILAAHPGFVALNDPALQVQSQHGDRGSPFRAETGDGHIGLEFKMMIPFLRARVVEASGFIAKRIKRGDFGALVLVATPARRTEIVESVFTAMFFGNDMINMKLNRSIIRGNKTVFAAAAGTLQNLALLSCSDGHNALSR